jgi:hypothetical protein
MVVFADIAVVIKEAPQTLNDIRVNCVIPQSGEAIGNVGLA